MEFILYLMLAALAVFFFLSVYVHWDELAEEFPLVKKVQLKLRSFFRNE